MKLFFLTIPFICMLAADPKPSKKMKAVLKKETKTDYQFPSAFIFPFN